MIAIDIDDVLAAFTPHAHKYFGIPLEKCDYWCVQTMDAKLGQGWFVDRIQQDRKFWDTLPVLSKPEDINFDFDCYISSFPVEMFNSRQRWLRRFKFPDKPLICTFQKLEYCLENGITTIIDDKPATIKMFNDKGLKGIHFITPYAGFEPVGPRIITNLNQVNDVL